MIPSRLKITSNQKIVPICLLRGDPAPPTLPVEKLSFFLQEVIGQMQVSAENLPSVKQKLGSLKACVLL